MLHRNNGTDGGPSAGRQQVVPMSLRNLPKNRRRNLAALAAMVIVFALMSAPAIVLSLDGGNTPTYATFLSHGG